jgi:uncharacterized membrane protein
VIARARAKVADFAAWVDATAERLAAVATGWLFWPALAAIGLGAGAFGLAHPDKLGVLDTNKLSEVDRRHALLWVAAAAAAIALVHLAVNVVRRVRTGSWQVVHAASAANRWLIGLCALPFVAALRRPGIEADSPMLTLALVAGCAIFVGRVAYELPDIDDPEADAPPGPRRAALARAAAALAVGALVAGFAFLLARLALLQHAALATRTADLGVYANVLWQTAHGHPLACSFLKSGTHLSAHVDPILVLLAPIYRLYPHAATLLVAQAVWLASGAVPVYLLARDRLASRGAGVVFAAAWVLYPALQGLALDEFHSLALAAPLLVWLAYLLQRGATKRYVVVLALALACREDLGLVLAVFGAAALASRTPRARALGAVTVLASIAWFVLARLVLLRAGGLGVAGPDAAPYEATWEAMIPDKNGLAGLAASIVANPAFAVKTAFAEAKVDFLLVSLVPLALLPLAAKGGRAALAVGLAACLLASRAAVFGPPYRYAALFFPFAFALAPLGVARLERGALPGLAVIDGRRLRRALLGAVLAASLLASWKLGALTDNLSFKPNGAKLVRALTTSERETSTWLRATIERIPAGAAVAATPKLGPHAADRARAYAYPERSTTEYVLADETELRGPELERHQKAVSRGELVELARRGRMALFRRKQFQD